MELQHFLRKVESIFPLNSAIEHDKVGLQLDSGKKEITRCLIAYEITDEVATEACSGGFDCIVTFHPLIFLPLQTITSDRRVGRVITRLIAAGIAVIVIHTNLDTHPRGTNMALAQMLQLGDCRYLQPNAYNPERGMGVLGIWKEPKNIAEAATFVARHMDSRVRYTAYDTSMLVSRVAIVAGSGYDFLDCAIKQGAEVFITADAKYHNFHAAKDTIALIEVGHQEMERHVPDILYTLLAEEVGDIEFSKSMVNTNPIHYI